MIKRNIYKKIIIKSWIKSGKWKYSGSTINSPSPLAYFNYARSYTQDKYNIRRDVSRYLKSRSYSRTNEFRSSQPC